MRLLFICYECVFSVSPSSSRRLFDVLGFLFERRGVFWRGEPFSLLHSILYLNVDATFSRGYGRGF